MRSLFEDGVIYMNTLEFYRTLEAHDERRDVNEGAERVRNRKVGVLKRKNPETGTFEEIAQLTHSRIRELNSNLQQLNVFCLYYLKSEMPIKSLGAMIVNLHLKLTHHLHLILTRLSQPDYGLSFS